MYMNKGVPPIKDLKEAMDNGFKCIYYELNQSNMFTVYLKNFNTEKVKVLEFEGNFAEELKTYITQLS